MYKIVRKKELNANVTLMDIEAPFVARKAKAGQFIIFRIDEMGERVPLTIAGYDREKGTVSIIFQKVGFTTKALGELNEGDYIRDFVGPLGKPTDVEAVSYTHLDVYKRQSINNAIEEKMQRVDKMVEKVARLVSQATDLPAISAASRSGQLTVKRYDLILAGPGSVILVLMLSNEQVGNKLIKLPLDAVSYTHLHYDYAGLEPPR